MSKSSTQTLFFFLILAVLSYAVWQLYFSDKKTLQLEPFTKGYSLAGIDMNITDERGNISTHVSASQAIYYEKEELLDITQPVVVMYSKESEEEWRFSSSTGEYRENEKAFFFPDNVLIVGVLDKTENDVRIKTSALLVKPNLNSANTENDIDIVQSSMMMQGKGALLNFNNQEFEIKENVKAKFIP